MERGLQKVNEHSRLVEWCQRVIEWCAEHGIPVSTYYSWQKKVFRAVSMENEVYFAEIPIKPARGETAASIQCGELRIDIQAGADVETIRAII